MTRVVPGVFVLPLQEQLSPYTELTTPGLRKLLVAWCRALSVVHLKADKSMSS